jgi:hypothetical protein
MSNTLELNCWVLGDDPSRVFAVEIASSKTVSFLKETIKDKKKRVFDDIDADSLNLWKVSNVTLRIRRIYVNNFVFRKVDINLRTNSDLLRSIKVDTDIPEAEELKPWDQLLDVFENGAKYGHLRIIVRPSAGAGTRNFCRLPKIMVHPIDCQSRQNACFFSATGCSVSTTSNADTSSTLRPEFPRHGSFQPGSAF